MLKPHKLSFTALGWQTKLQLRPRRQIQSSPAFGRSQAKYQKQGDFFGCRPATFCGIPRKQTKFSNRLSACYLGLNANA